MMENDGGRSEKEALMKDATKETPWSFRPIIILVSLCVSFVLEYGTVSLLSPFLPTEAHERGVSLSVVGIIFGCFPFTACVFAPIWGRLIPRCGAHRILVCGLVLSSTCVFLFAICKLLNTATSFALTALVLRSLSAIGASACETSSMCIALGEFPQNLGLVTGVLQTFAAVGLAIGPALGGFLYTAGGFQFPFFVFGSILAAIVPIFVALYKKQLQEPKTDDQKGEEKEDDKENISPILKALQIPGVILIAFCFVTDGTVFSITGPILAPYLKPAGFDAFHIGLIFLISPVCFGVLAPVMGWIGDKTHCYRVMMMVGFTGLGVDFLLLGPAPFLSSVLPTRKFWLICVVIALNGALGAVVFVSLMPELKNAVRDYGMADNASTNAIMSGIFTSAINLGATIGPVLGGILYQHLGFQWATTVEAFICISQALIVIAFFTIENWWKGENQLRTQKKVGN